MDGKLCLWSERVRTQCVELHRDSIHPVSKVVSDSRYNVALACGYDGNIAIWNFGSDQDSSSSSGGRAGGSRVGGNGRGAVVRSTASSRASASAANFTRMSSLVPTGYLTAHSEPVLECSYCGNSFASGDKAGALIVWDLQRGAPKHRFRAHPGPVTGVHCMDDRNTIITSGTDGFVKIWDPRTEGSGLVAKIPAHAQPAPGGGSGGGGGGGGRGGGGGGSDRGRGSRARPAWDASPSEGSLSGSGNVIRVSGGRGGGGVASTTATPVACMSVVYSRGSSGDVSHIITGGGGAQDSSLAVLDARRSFQPVCRWDHHQNGIYSLCVVGDECILSGDGVGTLMCHHLLSGEAQSMAGGGGRGGGGGDAESLRYGIGASEMGGIRSINCVNGKVVTAGEDGKVLVFDYDALGDVGGMVL